MFLKIRRVAVAVAVACLSVGSLSGCVTVNPGPSAPTVGVTAPPPPNIPVDPNKSIEEQVEELKTGFAKVYCPVRELPIADAIIDEAKRLWNEIAARAQQQGGPVPGFDPNDPAMCQ